MKQKNLKHLTTLIVACFLLSSLAFMYPAKAQDNLNTWTITVTDQNGNPVQGASISLYETVTADISYPFSSTNANGIITFTAPTPPNDGGYTLVETAMFSVAQQGWCSNWVEIKNADLQDGQPVNVQAYFKTPLTDSPPYSGSAPFKPYTPLTPTPSPYYFPTPTGLTGLFSTNNLLVVGIVIAFALGVWMLKVAFSKERKKQKKQRN